MMHRYETAVEMGKTVIYYGWIPTILAIGIFLRI